MLSVISGVSHLDHNFTQGHIEWLGKKFHDRDWLKKQNDKQGMPDVLVVTLDFPEELGPLPCKLVGPLMDDPPVSEDEVVYDVRGSRKYATRYHVDTARKPRPVYKMTVIAGAQRDHNFLLYYNFLLYTAYGGPAAPREPGDTSIDSWQEIKKSRKFWAEHALLV